MNTTKNIRANGSREPIPIIGIGCALPGYLGSSEGYWTCFAAGVSGIVPPPKDHRSIGV